MQSKNLYLNPAIPLVGSSVFESLPFLRNNFLGPLWGLYGGKWGGAFCGNGSHRLHRYSAGFHYVYMAQPKNQIKSHNLKFSRAPQSLILINIYLLRKSLPIRICKNLTKNFFRDFMII